MRSVRIARAGKAEVDKRVADVGNIFRIVRFLGSDWTIKLERGHGTIHSTTIKRVSVSMS